MERMINGEPEVMEDNSLVSVSDDGIEPIQSESSGHADQQLTESEQNSQLEDSFSDFNSTSSSPRRSEDDSQVEDIMDDVRI